MPETNIVSVQILNSWKEIANYLNRGVRTVQRWEAELGLPVRRPRGRRRSAVIAMRSEIDQWLNSCPLEARELVAAGTAAPQANNGNGRNDGNGRHVMRGVSDLILTSRLLREDLHRSQKELEGMLQRLLRTIQEYRTLTDTSLELKPHAASLLDMESTRVA